MTRIGESFAEAAAACVGVPFRLGGRNPELGLDCVGLVWASLKAIGHDCEAPSGYGLRNTSIAKHLCFARSAGFSLAGGSDLPGDLLLTIPGPAQHHLAIIASGKRYIHAHAGCGRVVSASLPVPWPISQHWRLRA